MSGHESGTFLALRSASSSPADPQQVAAGEPQLASGGLIAGSRGDSRDGGFLARRKACVTALRFLARRDCATDVPSASPSCKVHAKCSMLRGQAFKVTQGGWGLTHTELDAWGLDDLLRSACSIFPALCSV